MSESVFEQARRVSSGTLATLSGLTRYEDLERVRWRFITWVLVHPEFKDWREAWLVFAGRDL